MPISQCHFVGPPLEIMGPLLGPLKPTAFLKPIGPFMGPLKSMGPGVIVPPDPPLSAALAEVCTRNQKYMGRAKTSGSM